MVKLFVGKLNATVMDQHLKALFAQYGTVENAEVVKCRAKDQVIGFVHMPVESEAMFALRKLNRQQFMGSLISVCLSQVKIQKFFVGNCGDNLSDDSLRSLFETYGYKVTKAEYCDGKNFGFVWIENDHGQTFIQRLMQQMNNMNFNGKRIRVEISQDLSKEEKARRKAEKDAELYDPEWDEWDNTPAHLRSAPGFSGVGGRGGGSQGGFGRGGGPGRGLAKPFPGPSLLQGGGGGDFGGGYGPAKDESKELLGEYYSMMFENITQSQTTLFETGEFSDYVIQCEGMEFKVHRVVLAPKSDVFMNIMTNQPSPMVIKDVDAGTLQILLRFMYSSRVDVDGINPAKIMKLLTAADLYQVENVRDGLEATLMENVNEETAVDYLIFGEELQLANLRLDVSKYICKNSRKFRLRPDFKKLSQYPHLVMELFDTANF